MPLGICEVTGVALDIDRHWDLDLDLLRAALRPNTKLISINFPNNPTGKILPRAIFDALVEICRSRGIWLFSDEVYRLIERDPALRLPQAADVYERGISLNVMSKAYGLAGLRIGWLACKDRATLVKFERYKHFLSICNSAPSEVLARIALKAREKILLRNRAVVRDNLSILSEFFSDYAHLFEWREPDGGCVGFIRYKGAEGVEEFTRRLVEESGVLFLPIEHLSIRLGSRARRLLAGGIRALARAGGPRGAAPMAADQPAMKHETSRRTIMRRFRFCPAAAAAGGCGCGCAATATAVLLAIATASLAAAPGGTGSPDKKPDADSEKPDGGKFEPFKPESATSTGTVTIGGQAIAYEAIAGTLIVHPKGWDDVPRDPKSDKESGGPAEEGGEGKNPTAEASMFYVAYFKSGAAGKNGGARGR